MLHLNISDLKIESFRQGTSRSNTFSVRITHIPTGIVVKCSAYPTYIANEKGALAKLKIALADVILGDNKNAKKLL